MTTPTPLQIFLTELASAINEVHSAFGAPGDYGYGTREGNALFELYKLEARLGDIVSLAKGERLP